MLGGNASKWGLGLCVGLWLSLAGALSAQAQDEDWRIAHSNFPPYGFAGEGGETMGLAADLLRIMAADQGVEVTFDNRSNPKNALAAVEAGEANIIPNLTPTDERRKTVLFTEPYTWLAISLYGRPEAAERMGRSYEGTTIGYVHGSITSRYAKDFNSTSTRGFNSPAELMLALAAGEIDAAIFAEVSYRKLTKILDLQSRFVAIGTPIDRIPLTIAVDRTNPALFARVSASLERAMQTAAFAASAREWLQQDDLQHQTVQALRRYLGWAAGAGVALFLALVAVMFISRQRLLRAALMRAEEQTDFATNLGRLNDELEFKNREMENLLYVATHDLKSPLISISGFAKRAQRGLETGDTDGSSKALERVVRNIETMGALIDGILELGRIGRKPPELDRVSLSELVEDLRLQLHPQLQARQAELVFSDLPDVVTDPSFLRRALQNYIENALVYGCPEPGMQIEVLVEVETDHTRIGVRDHGPGVHQSYRDQIFSLYQQLPGTSRGTGLGLSIVKKIADTLGGSAWLEPTAGGGATFWISFRAKTWSTPALEAAA